MHIEPFQESWLLPGGLLQTVVGHLLPPTPSLKPQTSHNCTLADGEIVTIDENSPSESPKGRVVTFHGLGGCAESKYNWRLADKLVQDGYQVLRVNQRGFGNQRMGKARQIYHAGRTEDFSTILTFADSLGPLPTVFVSFSLSASTHLLWLGRDHRNPQIRASLAVCPPLDLLTCSQRLSELKNIVLDRYYTILLKDVVKKRNHHFPDLSPTQLPRNLTLRQFDEAFTAPRAGFSSASAYYKSCSSQPHLSKITHPTTILGADNDPIIPPRGYDLAKPSSSTEMKIVRGGGHMGFVDRRPGPYGDYRWMETFIVSWVRNALT